MHISNYSWPFSQSTTRHQRSPSKRNAAVEQHTQIVPKGNPVSIGDVANFVSALSMQEIVALTECLIDLLDRADSDPDLEDSYDQEWIDEREAEDGF